ncbi:hypothetical protein [Gemmiger sp.]
MRNTLEDLNNHLFEAMERLNDEDLTEEQLDKELKRADGMTKIAGQIIQNAELSYKVMVHMAEYGYSDAVEAGAPAMLTTKGGE